MSNKTFIMLAAPGMIGKSSAAKLVTESYPSVSRLENDSLMHELFQLVRLPNPNNVAINKVEEWRKKVNLKADCDALIRLLHRDWLAQNSKHSVFLAEGYPYMCQWYRNQARDGLQRLDFTIEYWLLQ